MDIIKFGKDDAAAATAVMKLIKRVFDEPANISEDYMRQTLAAGNFWCFGARDNDCWVGGLTGIVMPNMSEESNEIMIYDIAVEPDYQRQGVASKLVKQILSSAAEAGISSVFVPAHNDDSHAIDFYHAIGGEASSVSHFEFAVRAKG